jgi:hypothetical protein
VLETNCCNEELQLLENQGSSLYTSNIKAMEDFLGGILMKL